MQNCTVKVYFALMKPFMLFASSIILILFLIPGVGFINRKDKVPEHHLEVVLRDIGHQLLLSAKDSSSRVLPIKKLNDHTYQVSFQNNFSFISDSLIDIVQREFQKNAWAKEYIVNLRSCKQQETVFAFEMNGQSGNLTPCRGRTLEVGCYFIDIELLKTEKFNFFWLLLLLVPIGVAGFYGKDKFRKTEAPAPVVDDSPYLPLGTFRFHAENNVLKIDDRSISLSDKETKALKIFAEHINQIVEREKLLKEIWEDKGVVVISRNVDVLVSNLRRKLSDDGAIRFINVPGRGYKLMIG